MVSQSAAVFQLSSDESCGGGCDWQTKSNRQRKEPADYGQMLVHSRLPTCAAARSFYGREEIELATWLTIYVRYSLENFAGVCSHPQVCG
jgi:hypothetical protein